MALRAAALGALAAAAMAAPAAAPRRVLAWMCLERCNDTSADIQAQLADLRAHPGVMTGVSYELFNLGPDSTLVVNNLTDVGPALQALGLERHAMVSSYPYPPQFLEYMRAVFANPQPFIAACIAQAQARNLTGFNIDWEPAGAAPTPQDAADYAAFLSVLADALHAHGLQVSVDFAEWSGIWDLKLLGQTSLDWLADMGTYTSPWAVWQQQLKDALAAIPLDKLVVGLETTVTNSSGLAPRFAAIQEAGLRSVAVWRMPLSATWWNFLKGV